MLAITDAGTSVIVVVILQAFGILLLIVKALIDWKTEDRKRRWLIEDKATVLQSTQTIGQKIDENTNITQKAVDDAAAAYSEANQHNRKIADFQAELHAIATEVRAMKSGECTAIELVKDLKADIEALKRSLPCRPGDEER